VHVKRKQRHGVCCAMSYCLGGGISNLLQSLGLSKPHTVASGRLAYSYSRFIKSAGSLLVLVHCRFQTEYGQAVGPYRVWLQEVRLPGLAMSRAMGDRLAQS
jgi:hypothetical protein